MQLNFAQVEEQRLLAQLAHLFSWLQRMAHMHNYVCHLVKFVTLMFVAAQLLVKLETQSKETLTTEKQAVCAGRASAHQFAVLL
jgi:hypothetical protein